MTTNDKLRACRARIQDLTRRAGRLEDDLHHTPRDEMTWIWVKDELDVVCGDLDFERTLARTLEARAAAEWNGHAFPAERA